MIAQNYFKTIRLDGIICEDGFLTFPESICMIEFWLNKLQSSNIPVYSGISRTAYLRQQRNFPEIFITSFLDSMKIVFGYSGCSSIPIVPSVEELAQKWKSYPDNSIFILTTGNVNSLAWILKKHQNLSKKIHSVYSMISNVHVSGNVIPADPSMPNIVPNSEYNAFLDPDSLTDICNFLSNKLKIVPLDCTNYAPLNKETIIRLKSIGDSYLKNCSDPFVINNYNLFIQLLETTIRTINSDLYLWDLVATMIFLQTPSDQKCTRKKLFVSWTGQLQKSNNSHDCILYYNYIDYNLLLQNIIRSIFKKVCLS
jgi:inosine-uridine nucleoside N-ribohydrolase